MNRVARIESVDALKNLRTFLSTFAKKISVAIDEADFDIVQTLNWLKHDCKPHWNNELRIRNELYVKAKLELKRKQYLERSPLGGHSSHIDEKKALALAQKRLEEAQSNVDKIRGWIPKLEKESFDCRGVLQSLSNFIHVDLPNKRTQIDRMIYALESYLSTAAPTAASPTEASAGEETAMSRAVPSLLTEKELLCKELRRKNPLKDITLGIPTEKPVIKQFKKFAFSNEMLALLKKNSSIVPSFSDDDVMAFDQTIKNTNYIYLENVSAVTGEIKIKWLIAPVKLETAASYAVCQMAVVIKKYPLLRDILSLPEGWLVILKNNGIDAVFDADDQLISSAPDDAAKK